MPAVELPSSESITLCQGSNASDLSQTGILHDLSSVGNRGLSFVISSGVEKPNQELRKLIRSHVMLGKNKGKKLPPRKKKLGSRGGPAQRNSELPLSSDALSTTTWCPTARNGLLEGSAFQVLPDYVPAPRQFGSYLSTLSFADAAVEPRSVEVVIRFSSIAKNILFPNLEAFIFFDRRAETWIAPLAFDPAFLHAMIFTSQYFFDNILRLQSSSSVSCSTASIPHQLRQPHFPHYVTALKLLNERIASGDEKAIGSFTTAATIMGLVGHAHMSGDVVSARHHMEGLGKIVRMRGGVGSFEGVEKLLIEILRCDLGIAIQNGSRPVIFDDLIKEPFVPYPNLKLFLDPSMLAPKPAGILNRIDDRLRHAWESMSDFCSVINLVTRSEQRISTRTFLDMMASVMYRLLHMNVLSGSTSEAIRLGLIAFTSSVFLPWKNLGTTYAHLSSEFRCCLEKLIVEGSMSKLTLWLLVMGASTVLDKNDEQWLKPLLQENIHTCGIESWLGMREVMTEFLWIDIVFDKIGKEVYDSITITH